MFNLGVVSETVMIIICGFPDPNDAVMAIDVIHISESAFISLDQLVGDRVVLERFHDKLDGSRCIGKKNQVKVFRVSSQKS
jgi:hypothetical protein